MIIITMMICIIVFSLFSPFKPQKIHTIYASLRKGRENKKLSYSPNVQDSFKTCKLSFLKTFLYFLHLSFSFSLYSFFVDIIIKQFTRRRHFTLYIHILHIFEFSLFISSLKYITLNLVWRNKQNLHTLSMHILYYMTGFLSPARRGFYVRESKKTDSRLSFSS